MAAFLAVSACSSTPAPAVPASAPPQTAEPTAAEPEAPVEAAPSEPTENASEGSEPFRREALLVGVCDLGTRVFDAVDDEQSSPEGPVVFSEGPTPLRAGEPLWVMTAAGSLERAEVERPFPYCPSEDEPAAAPKCWQAATLRTSAPLVCANPLTRAERLSAYIAEPPQELDHFLALPRTMSPPKPVALRGEIRVYGGRCRHLDAEPRENAKPEKISDPEDAIARHVRAQFGIDDAWARRIVSLTLGESGWRLHVVHAERRAPGKQGARPRHDLLVVEADERRTEVWPEDRRHQALASRFLRDHYCGLPAFGPYPMVALEDPQSSDASLVLIVEDDGVKTSLWSLRAGALEPVRTFAVEHRMEYF